jgi:isopenicillin-N epimerase
MSHAALPPLPHPDAPFGHPLRPHWSLDPSIHFLNHGSYGAAPKHVLAAQTQWRDRLELEPVRFMADELPEVLAVARARLAAVVGAGGRDDTADAKLAFVENATAGANAVLRSFRWLPGDRIVIANHAYPALKNLARFVAERHGVTVVEAQVPWPLPDAQALVEAYDQALGNGARLAIVDHIFSPLAVVAPLDPIIAACRARGTQVLVDGAHAPGQLPLVVDDALAAGADWYVGNCHKWLCAPKGAGFLVASERGQRELHPAVISNYYGEGFDAEFAWTGTGDPTARLSVSAALDFIEALGAVRYRDALRSQARDAGALIADAWGVAPAAPPDMFAAMVTLPVPVAGEGTREAALRWRAKLLRERRVEVPVIPIDGRLFVRISAQVYNELSDYEALARSFG